MKSYKGYLIWAQWRTEDFGFRAIVMDQDWNLLHRSEAFFYEENAMKYAKSFVNRIVDLGSAPHPLEKENTNNWRRMHGLPMRRRRSL